MQSLALALGIIALISDALDGAIARRTGGETELGRFLDPMADKVLAAAVAVTLLIYGLLPLWYVLLVVVRDGAIVAGSLVFHSRVGMVAPSLPVGKVAATSIGIVLLAAIAGIDAEHIELLAWLSSALLLWSIVVYAARLWRAVRPYSLSNH